MEVCFEQLDDFCTLCGTLLPLPQTAPSKIQCDNCECKWSIGVQKNKVVYVREKIYETTNDNSQLSTELEEGAVVEHVCPKCEFNQATYSTMQTRSADEGQTVFYTCLKCGRKDIEYS